MHKLTQSLRMINSYPDIFRVRKVFQEICLSTGNVSLDRHLWNTLKAGDELKYRPIYFVRFLNVLYDCYYLLDSVWSTRTMNQLNPGLCTQEWTICFVLRTFLAQDFCTLDQYCLILLTLPALAAFKLHVYYNTYNSLKVMLFSFSIVLQFCFVLLHLQYGCFIYKLLIAQMDWVYNIGLMFSSIKHSF